MKDLADRSRAKSVVSRQAKSVSFRYVLIFGLLLAPLVWRTAKATQATGEQNDQSTSDDPGQEMAATLGDSIDADVQTLDAIRNPTKKQKHYEEREKTLEKRRMKDVLKAAASYARVRDNYVSMLDHLLSFPGETPEPLNQIEKLSNDAKDDPVLADVGGADFSKELGKAITSHNSWKKFKEAWRLAETLFEKRDYVGFQEKVANIEADFEHRKYAESVKDFEELKTRAEFLKGVEPLRPADSADSTVELSDLKESHERINKYLERYPKPPALKLLDKEQHALLISWSRELGAAISWQLILVSYPTSWKPESAAELTEFFDKARKTIHDLKGDQKKPPFRDKFLPSWLSKRLADKPFENRSSGIHEARRNDPAVGWEFGEWVPKIVAQGNPKKWLFTPLGSDQPLGETRTQPQYTIQPRLPITEELVVRYNRAREQLLAGERWKSNSGWKEFQKELTAIVQELHEYADTGGLERANEYKLSSISRDYFDSENRFATFVLEAWPSMDSLLKELSSVAGLQTGIQPLEWSGNREQARLRQNRVHRFRFRALQRSWLC